MTMPQASTASQMPRMTGLVSMLCVEDLHRTITFYTELLGFTLDNTFGEPPVWCSLSRDRVQMMFNTPGAEHVRRDVPKVSRDYQVYYIHSDDVVGLRASLLGRGVEAGELRVTVYGMKEFEVRDPDGIWLWFGQATDEPPTVTE